MLRCATDRRRFRTGVAKKLLHQGDAAGPGEFGDAALSGFCQANAKRVVREKGAEIIGEGSGISRRREKAGDAVYKIIAQSADVGGH